MKEKHECAKRIYAPHMFHGTNCSVNAKYFENEEWWCHHHAPSKIQERRDAERAEWKREQDTTERVKNSATARQLAVLRVLNGENLENQLGGWDVSLETRRQPHFTYTGGIVLSYKAVEQLLIKLGVDPKTVQS